MSPGLLRTPLRHGVAGALPRGEPAVHLRDALEAHLLGRVGGQRGAPGAVAIEDELLARSEDVLGVGALRIDPELEHAARAVEGIRDHAIPLELPDVADVDEDDVVSAMARTGLRETERADARLRLVH